MDTLVHRCREQGIEDIYGYYYPTAKNGMVKEFYALLGFDKLEEDTEGNTKWCYHINDTYENKNKVIDVEE